MELNFERGFLGRVWALTGYVNWALCCRHENLKVSHRHNNEDEVFETWLPFPGLTKPIMGISKQIKKRSLGRDKPSREKGNNGNTQFYAQSNKINSRKESYLNEIFSMQEERDLQRVNTKE